MILNDADTITLGNTAVKRVYLNYLYWNFFVWGTVDDLIDDTKINVIRLNEFGRRTDDIEYFDPTQAYITQYGSSDALTAARSYIWSRPSSFFECMIGKSAGETALQKPGLYNGGLAGCQNVVSVLIYANVSEIPYSCFAACDSLSRVQLPQTVATIRYQAFAYEKSLKSIEIPASIQTIESGAFYDSVLEIIRIHKPYGSISGAPWGATNANVIWDT